MVFWWIHVVRQEFVQSADPVLGVVLVGSLEPDERTLDIRLVGHWSETETRIVTDQTVAQLPFRLMWI